MINAAASLGRRVVLTGRDVEKVVKTAIRMGYIKLPDDDILAKTKELKGLAPEKTVILETGRMGADEVIATNGNIPSSPDSHP